MYKVVEKDNIENMIYEIRGVGVMLDSDLAKLFEVETGNLNKAMKRNINRFPKEFCFRLTSDEYNFLLFQIGRPKKKGELLLKDKPYSAYKTILDILNTVTKEVIIIDSYADITFLDLIRNIKCNVVLITRDSNRLSNIEIEKY